MNTVKSATYVRASDRTDDQQDTLLGDVTYVRFNECEHVMHGTPHMHFKVGARQRCRACEKEAAR